MALYSIFLTVNFLGKVHLLAHIQCLHFSHFCFNSISITLKLCLLKPCSHLRSKLDAASSVSHLLSLDASLSVHHSFLEFFFFFFFPLFHFLHPVPSTDGSDSSLAISSIHSLLLTSEVLKTQRTLFSVFLVGDRLCLLMLIVTGSTLT